MCEELTYTFQELMTTIPIANKDEMKHIISTVTKEKSLYGVLTMSAIQQAISKRLKVLGSPVIMFSNA